MYIYREDIKLWNTKHYFICARVSDDTCPLFSWHDGKKKSGILKPYLPLTYFTDVKTDPGDCVPTSEGMYLGNEKLRDVFIEEIENDEIEILPGKIINKKLEKEYNYWLFHVINLKKIIDLKQSKLSKYSDDVGTFFLEIKLNYRKIPANQNIFYDPHMLNEFIISDSLAEKIINAKLTGMEVIPIEEYKDKFYKE